MACSPFQNLAFTLFLILYFSKSVHCSANLDTLVQAQVLFRHGARTIDDTYSVDPYLNESFWSPGYSQLNNLGKYQAYNLGLYLRQRYNGFLKPTYDLKDLYVLSSDFARTLQTAASVLAGLYLPNQILFGNNDSITNYLSNNNLVEIPLPWKSVPIHAIPVEHDNLIRQQAEICPRYNYLFNNLYKDNAEVARFLADNRDILEYVYNETPVGAETLSDFLRLMDTLLLEKYYNMTLPGWSQPLFRNDRPTNLFQFLLQMITFTEELKRLRVGPFIERLIENMVLNESLLKDNFTRARSGRKKLYLFSGHDYSLAGLLDTFGVFDKKRPDYTAAVIVELHQRPLQKLDAALHEDNLYVEIYFRNETRGEIAYQMEIPGCGLQCPLEAFIKLYKPYIPKDWDLECQFSWDPNAGESSTLSPGWIVLIILAGLLVLFVLIQFWTEVVCNKRSRIKSYMNIP